ncbi:sugar ABC transporter permease [Paenibacillus sp. FSL H7-0331]|uniref:ABC transporter permease n=1 Tax=Paenibacillus sp. FSL H7-0331 TaxID=1920421 RepID=UPI00096EA60F|nr:ABC transporter permease subunit [Paenibacillus sp. FSL H7-0331]OMF05807.1 polysaccharide ABC transporter ATP-binding protein [Paenibacillus sp. FSL H7-0331]
MNSTAAASASNKTHVRTKWQSSWKRIMRFKILYLLLLPELIYFVIFKYVPMFGIIIAFKNYNIGLGFWDSPWVGLNNFRNFISGVYFWDIMSNTIAISIYKLLFGFIAPIVLALLINEVTVGWFKKTVQTVTYLPHFISWVIAYGLMVALLSPGDGFVNLIMKQYGLQPISFLTESSWIRSLIIGSDIWKEVGWGAILYLAALAGIDPSLYEAARIDGASKWRQLWHITLPGIRNVIIILLIIRLSSILDAGFDQIFMMSNTFNADKSDIIDTWVYRQGIEQMQISLATAVGVFKSVIAFILVVGANKLAKKFDGQIW